MEIPFQVYEVLFVVLFPLGVTILGARGHTLHCRKIFFFPGHSFDELYPRRPCGCSCHASEELPNYYFDYSLQPDVRVPLP